VAAGRSKQRIKSIRVLLSVNSTKGQRYTARRIYTYSQEKSMNWIERFNRAVNFVEENLMEEISTKEIADQANTSSFHFQRMFSILTDITLAEYIRRRRLTLASKEILAGSEILETAIKYGYESQASFTRAYSRLFGFSPGVTREPGIKLQAYPPISFQISIKGVHAMNYEIREVGSFNVAGYMREFTTRDGENLKMIPRFWEESGKSGKIDSLMSQADPSGAVSGSCLGICMEMNENQEDFHYMIGMEPRSDADLSGLEERKIKAQTWAVFPGFGEMPQAIQKVWKRIFGEWFPATEYEHAGGPEMEVYLPAEQEDAKEIPFEIWIPVKKK